MTERDTVLRFDAGVAKGSTVDFAKVSGGDLFLADSQSFRWSIEGCGGSNNDKIALTDVYNNCLAPGEGSGGALIDEPGPRTLPASAR